MQFLLKQMRRISGLFKVELRSVVLSKVSKNLPLYSSLFFGFLIIFLSINLTWKILFPINNLTYSLESFSEKESSLSTFNDLSGDPFAKIANQAVTQTFNIEAPPTSLSLRLYGIRYSDSGEADAAILGFDAENQSLYKTNEVISGDITLEFIEPERVVISRGGIRESITFDKDAVLSPQVTKSLTKNYKKGDFKGLETSTLNRMISFQPYFSDGTLKGYQLYPGKESDFFKRSGLKAGDVLVAVNGLDIKDPSVVKELSAFGQIQLDLIRDNNDFSINVQLN